MLTTAQMSGAGHLATLDLQNSLTLMSKLRSAIVNFVHYKAERPLAPAGSKRIGIGYHGGRWRHRGILIRGV